MAASSAKEDALSSHITAVTGDIRALERRAGDVAARLKSLQADLDLHRARLARLTELLDLQTERLDFLARQYTRAMDRLDRRFVELYKEDKPTHARRRRLVGELHRRARPDRLHEHLGDQDVNASAQVRRGARRDADRCARRRATRSAAGRRRHAGDRGPHGAAARAPERAAGTEEAGSRRRASRSSRRSRRCGASTATTPARPPRSQQVRRQLEAQIQAAQAARRAASRRISPIGRRSRSRRRPSSGFIWPVSGPVVEPVRHALGPHARGHRHRRRLRHADPRGRVRHGDHRGLGGRLRQPDRRSTTAAASRRRTATSRASRSATASTSSRAR